jgi:hypothetical protein
MSALDDLLAAENEVPRTKAALDSEVCELSQEQQLAMTARRAADLFDHCSMYATGRTAARARTAADLDAGLIMKATARRRWRPARTPLVQAGARRCGSSSLKSCPVAVPRALQVPRAPSGSRPDSAGGMLTKGPKRRAGRARSRSVPKERKS